MGKKKFIDLFKKPKFVPCGGDIQFDVLDTGNKAIASLFMSRPDSATKLNFVYETQNGLATEPNLRELKDTPEKDRAKKCHEIMWRDLCIPFARKLFVRCHGFTNESGESIGHLSRESQLELLEKWYSNVLVDAVLYAFNDGIHLKKK